MPSAITVTLMGHVGKDPERREFDGGSVVNFSLAANYYDRKKKESVPAWFNVSVWGKAGDRVMQHVSKGSPVYVVGELRPREYDKDGQTRTALDVSCYTWTFAGSKNDNTTEDVSSKPTAQPQAAEDDDLPF